MKYWAQTDCIWCNGPYQSNWTTWRDGYKLIDDRVWILNDSTNPFKTTQYIYITLLVICNIVLLVVASFLDWPSEISQLVIYSNQTMLILLLICDAQSSNMIKFMSALQLVKLDLKIFDNILNLRSAINSVFYKEQYTSMQSLNFESGSTFANYSNALLVCFIFLVLYFIALAVKSWEKKSEINVLTKYIDAHIKLHVYITYVKLCFCIFLINCVSELMNQITLDDAHGDFKSYVFSDTLLIIVIWCMFVTFDSKLNKSIFKNKSMHMKVNLAKMLVYSFAFAFRNSWRFAKQFGSINYLGSEQQAQNSFIWHISCGDENLFKLHTESWWSLFILLLYCWILSFVPIFRLSLLKASRCNWLKQLMQ